MGTGSGDHGGAEPFDAATTALLSIPSALEVLGALEEHPRTVADLRRACPASAGVTAAALRALAAAGAIRRDDAAGSWDHPASEGTYYLLTAPGVRLIRRLWSFDAWVATYDRESTQDSEA